MPDDEDVAAVFRRDLEAAAAAARLRGAELLALYRTMRKAADLKRYLLVEYRCGVGGDACLLARIVAVPGVVFVFQPAYRLSPQAARQTVSGERSWPARAFVLPDPPVGLAVACGHTYGSRQIETVIAEIEAARRSRLRPVIHQIGGGISPI